MSQSYRGRFLSALSRALYDRGWRISIKGISSTSAPRSRRPEESALAWCRARPTRIRTPCSAGVASTTLKPGPVRSEDSLPCELLVFRDLAGAAIKIQEPWASRPRPHWSFSRLLRRHNRFSIHLAQDLVSAAIKQRLPTFSPSCTGSSPSPDSRKPGCHPAAPLPPPDAIGQQSLAHKLRSEPGSLRPSG